MPPYDGLPDLLNEFQLGQLRSVSSVEVAAFNVAAIDASSTVEGETAKLAIRVANGIPTEKVSINYRVLDQGRVVKRDRLGGDKFHWNATPDHQSGTIEFAVPRAAVLHCIAVYSGVAQKYYWVADPATFQNARRAAYEAFDPGIESLKDIFSKAQGRGAEARNFEAAISWLFWMLGFGPAHLGGTPRTQEAADLVMCTQSGNFAVVEVTTGLLKAENKLALLHDRTQSMRRNLDASNNRHLRMLPVIVTSKTQEDIRPDLEQAEKWGIYVLAREGLERLVERTLQLPNSDQLYEQAEQAVRSALARHAAEEAQP
jgi:hypothetical protein